MVSAREQNEAVTDAQPPPRYRKGTGSLDDSLQREVRDLTDDITQTRRELQRELPRRRRGDFPANPPSNDTEN